MIIKNNLFEAKVVNRKKEIELKSSTSLYGIISFINHGNPTDMNILRHSISPAFHMIYAKRDIKKGEEILIDYVLGTKDYKERSKMLES